VDAKKRVKEEKHRIKRWTRDKKLLKYVKISRKKYGGERGGQCWKKMWMTIFVWKVKTAISHLANSVVIIDFS
jgi:hypothetical protein